MLAKGFEEDKGDAVSKVEGPGFSIEHRNAEPLVRILFEQSSGQAGGFTPENEIISGTEIGLRVEAWAARLDEP